MKEDFSMSIYYKIIGEGYPVVMLHGWSLDHHVMLHTLEPLFENRIGWKRIYIDLPGMGQSTSSPSIQNSDQMLEAVLNLLDQIIPNEPFIVCGYSYGGYMARGIIHARPNQVHGAFLLAPMVVPTFNKRILPDHSVLRRDKNLLARLSPEEATEFGSMGVSQGEHEWERFQHDVLIPAKQADEAFLTHIQENGYGFSFDISTTLHYPALIITGRQDHIVGYQDTWQLIEEYPRATFTVLDIAGHNLQYEQINVINALVHEWLNRLEEEVTLTK